MLSCLQVTLEQWTISDRTPLARMLPSVIGIGGPVRIAARLSREAGIGTKRKADLYDIRSALAVKHLIR